VSLATLYQFSAGVVLWTFYGIDLGDIIIAANAITFLTLVVAIVLYYHYYGK
jgi:hypothetical protein